MRPLRVNQIFRYRRGGALLLRMSGVLLLLFLASCHHKDLCYEQTRTGHIEVRFDWRDAPSANPGSMALYLYDRTTGKGIRYIFQNKDGGTIKVPVGEYDAMCLNADLTDWAVISGRDDIEEYEVSTSDADGLPASGMSARSIPRAPGSEGERMAEVPGMLWGDRQDRISITGHEADKVITLYPNEKVCHYVVDVYDSGDVAEMPKGGIDAMLTGMSEGYKVGGDTPADEHVSNPFILLPHKADNSLHAEFLTFGEPATTSTHHISMYAAKQDGSKWNCNVDVSKSVHEAADPHHVHIIIRGVDIPKVEEYPAGVVPDVTDWETVNITLPM